MSGKQLLRAINTMPLLTLKQGCTLRILGSKRINLNVRIKSEWRDDTLLQLDQSLPTLSEIEKFNDEQGSPCYYGENVSQEAHMDVQLQKNVETSMKRKALMATVRVGLKKHNIEPPPSSTKDDGTTNQTLSSTKRYPPPRLVLTALIPEKMNVACELQGFGSISVENKVEGDINLKTKAGDIVVSKLRGHNVILDAGGKGIIHVKQLVEAENLNINVRGRLRAVMLNGGTVDVNVLEDESEKSLCSGFEKLDVDDSLALVDIGSLYTSRQGEGAQINVARAGGTMSMPRNVRIKSNHGHVGVNTLISPNATLTKDEYGQLAPVVELGGVNGSCDVSVECEESELPPTFSGMASRVHFDICSPGSISAITSERGDLAITMDRKIETDIKMLSSPDISNLDFNVLTVGEIHRLTPYDEELAVFHKKGVGISINTDAFTPSNEQDVHFKNFDFVNGHITNQSNEPESRYDVKISGGEGKINVDSAAAQALSGFQNELEQKASHRPLLVAVAGGKISLESTNWFGAIARRYGMDVDSILPNSRAFNREQDSKNVGENDTKPPQ